LREPLVVSGQLVYGGPTSLDRQVTEPYQEDTQIRGESVIIRRAGQQPRKFLLQRVPELRGLLSGLAALLAGDAQAVQRDFSVQLSGDDQQWQLDLTPTDARVRRRLELIRAQGSAAEPHCFSLLNRDGGVSIMLLGDVARAASGQALTREALESRCAGAR
jgi:Outer membrane lipoprotein carrier protein LolA-like